MHQQHDASHSASVIDACISNPLLLSYQALVATLSASAGNGNSNSPTSSLDSIVASSSSSTTTLQQWQSWCMESIQLLSQLAPAVRKTAPPSHYSNSSASATSSNSSAAALQHQHAALVLQFLNNMLRITQSKFHHDQAHDNALEDSTAASAASPSSSPSLSPSTSSPLFASRPNLYPFLYAHLFKYCLHLQEYDQYYQLLVSMPAVFPSSSSSSSAAAAENMKLEYLKRFLIELLRENKIQTILKYNWNFDWTPRSSTLHQHRTSSTISSDSVRRSVWEEVAQMLWWHAKSADIQDHILTNAIQQQQMGNSLPSLQPQLSSGHVGLSTTSGHYESLYIFLYSSHRFARAAQAALHYFQRVEVELGELASFTAFVARQENHATASRGRTGPGAAAATSAAASMALDKHASTLHLLEAIVSRKVWALTVAYDALQKASSNSESDQSDRLFMVDEIVEPLGTNEKEEDGRIADAASEGSHKRSRQAANQIDHMEADDDRASILSDGSFNQPRIELLSLNSISRRLEMLLAQLELIQVLRSNITNSTARGLFSSAQQSQLPLAISFLLDVSTPMRKLDAFHALLINYGLVDRSFRLLARLFQLPQRSAPQQQQVTAVGNQDKSHRITLHAFQLFSRRILRLYEAARKLSMSEDDEAASVIDGDLQQFPMQLQDSLQLLQLQQHGYSNSTSLVAVDVSSEERYVTDSIKQSELVLRYYLDQFDSTSLDFSLAVAQEYLVNSSAAAPLPLWLIHSFKRFAASSDDSEGIAEQENTFTMRSQAPLSAHRLTLQAFPFMSFLRLLLSRNEYELLFECSCFYLDWLATSEVDGRKPTLNGSVLAEVFDGFLQLQSRASTLPSSDPNTKQIKSQISEWVQTLKTKIGAVGKFVSTGASGRTNMLAEVRPSQPTTSFGFGSTPQQPAANSAFRLTSRFAPSGSPFSASKPTFAAASPAVPTTTTTSAFGASKPTPSAATAPFSFSLSGNAPSASPFADDESEAAAPTAFKPAAASTGFSFAAPASSTAAPSAAAPFSFAFGTPVQPPKDSTTTPFTAPRSSTSALIFNAASQADTQTPAKPFSFSFGNA